MPIERRMKEHGFEIQVCVPGDLCLLPVYVSFLLLSLQIYLIPCSPYSPGEALDRFLRLDVERLALGP
jgi:hypothetical protein